MTPRDDNLPPDFLIPLGTQVVLRYERPVPGTADTKPAGTVGVIAETPATNDRPYLVRFLDGVSFRLKFAELLVRRVDHSVEATATAGPDVSAFVVYRVMVGSRAFGLSPESSDEDRLGVLADVDVAFHRDELVKWEKKLDEAHAASKRPAEPPWDELDRFLVGLRLG
ncbi:MAG TPA: hypothetical protein VMZ71_10220 [Gemmataceae bacterium]|nr:hypothetical protein [Gemmataceae bacterium]